MPRLTNWTFKLLPNDAIAVGGNVAGHSSYPDGMYITTSALNGLDKGGAMLAVSTARNQYQLDLRNAQYKNAVPLSRAGAEPAVPEQLRMYYDIFAVLGAEYDGGVNRLEPSDAAELIRKNEDVFGEYRLNVEKFMTEAVRVRAEQDALNRDKKQQAKAKLQNRELYLELGQGGNFYFNFAVMKDKDGTVHEMDAPTVETALAETSVFLFGWDISGDFGAYDLRYFPRNGGRLEFYAWPTVPVYMRNSSGDELCIAIDGREEFRLAPDEERVIK